MATHSSILHGQRSLANYSPQGCTEPDTTEATWLTHMIRKDENFFKLSFLGGCISLDHIRLHAMGLPSCTQQESKRRQSSAAVIARINVQGLKLLPPPCPFSSSQSLGAVQPTCSRQKEGEGQREKVNCWPHWSE